MSSIPPLPQSSADDTSNWSSWARLVLANLERHEEQIDKIFNLCDTHRNEFRAEVAGIRAEFRQEISVARTEFLAALLQQSKASTEITASQATAWLGEVKQIRDCHCQRFGAHDVSIAELKQEIKLKSGIWGLLGGLIPAVGVLLYFLMQLKFKATGG